MERIHRGDAAYTPMPLPADLQRKLEYISGFYLGDVMVHYQSLLPTVLEAAAYAQGNNIYIASGYEYLLAHEAWHVVQQKQGRVQPMEERHGVWVNTCPQLEAEAYRMASILKYGHLPAQTARAVRPKTSIRSVVQCMTFEEAARIAQEHYAIGIVADPTDRPARLYLLMPTENLEEMIYGDRPDLLGSVMFYHRLMTTCALLLNQGAADGYFLIATPFAYEAQEVNPNLLKCCDRFSDFKIRYITTCEGYTPERLWELLKSLFPHLKHLSPDQPWDQANLDGFGEGMFFDE